MSTRRVSGTVAMLGARTSSIQSSQYRDSQPIDARCQACGSFALKFDSNEFDLIGSHGTRDVGACVAPTTAPTLVRAIFYVVPVQRKMK